MITLKVLKFSDCLPFGKNVEIDLTKSRTTQLVGKNGSGKSSIPLILEELLYNKNSKGLLKGDILNRFSGATEYSMSLTFTIDGVDYKIEKIVKSTAKVQLFKGTENISGHTATQTYKILNDILGMDASTFSKLVYQSLSSSLDFLTATDGNRKKFLIKLLNLDSYSEVEEQLKEVRKNTKATLEKAETKLEAIRKAIKAYVIPELMQELPVPESIRLEVENTLVTLENEKQELLDKLGALITAQANRDALLTIQKLELARYENLVSELTKLQDDYREAQLSLLTAESNKLAFINTPIPNQTELQLTQEKVDGLTKEIDKLKWTLDSTKKKYNSIKLDAELTKCPECGSTLDKAHARTELQRLKNEYNLTKALIEQTDTELSYAKGELSVIKKVHDDYIKRAQEIDLEHKSATTKFNKADAAILRFSEMNKISKESAISTKPTLILQSAKPTIISLDSEVANIDEIEKLKSLISNKSQAMILAREKLKANEAAISEALIHNAKVGSHNDMCKKLVDNQSNQLAEEADMEDTVDYLTHKVNNLDALSKIFGPKGLIAYKLESSVKTFEHKVNEYLSELSNGEFALGFELDDANLKVMIYSGGKPVSIGTLSSGELSKVNISTLLSIRSLMSAVAKNSLNVLFLDEVVSVLDTEGMGDLIDTLIKETELNTFVVSHNYQHPLVSVIKIIKEDKVSRLQYD